MKTIAIDFDGVIHKYSKGWQDGTCYDEPMDGAEDFLRTLLLSKQYSVFIFSTRSPRQIKRWLYENMSNTFSPTAVDCGQMWGGPTGWMVKRIPFWYKSWNRNDCIGITKRKLPAIMYIDDRAVRFEPNNPFNWKNIIDLIS